MADIPPPLRKDIEELAEVFRAKFSQPQFIPGCVVKSVTDVNLYATNNGWIEAVCGQHNQQRVRWKSSETVAVNDYVDVLHFPDRRLFEAWGIGGAGAIASASGGWPFDNVRTVSQTDANADHATLAAALAAASAGDVILLDAETFTLTANFDVNKAVTIIGHPGGTIITCATNSIFIITLSAAGASLRNLSVTHTGAGTTVVGVSISANNCIVENVTITSTGAANLAFGLYQVSGTGLRATNVRSTVSGASSSYGYGNENATASAEIYGGRFSGTTADIYGDQAGSTLTLVNPVLVNSTISYTGTRKGEYLDTNGKDYPRSAFAAHKNGTNQTGVVTATFTKLTATTELFDVAGDYDATNSKHTPLTAGYYLYTASVRLEAASDQNIFLVMIYLNGAEYKRGGVNTSGTQSHQADVTAIIPMNGSTDYVEFYVYHNTGVNRDINGSSNLTHIQGALLLRS